MVAIVIFRFPLAPLCRSNMRSTACCLEERSPRLGAERFREHRSRSPVNRGRLSGKTDDRRDLFVTFDLELKAEALHLADRIAKLLRQSKRRSRWVKVSDALSRLRNCTVSRGVFLMKVGGDEAEIEEMFREAIRTAKEQKSTCLTKRAEATYKNSAAGKGER
jgi:hypothetical protein